MKRLPLTALQVFEVAATQPSFSAAAAVLHVTPAAVSRQIKRLELNLGYALFEQLGRNKRLTAQGAAFVPEVQRGFAELRRAYQKASRVQEPHHLNVTMMSSFLQKWLLPRLHTFHAQYPAVDLRINTSTQLVNFGDSDYDAGIRFGGGRWSDIRATKLFEEWLLPVGLPDLARTKGLILKPSDLRKFTLLHAETEPWKAWLESVFGHDLPAPIGISLDDSAAIVLAAERGQGIALARWSLVYSEIESGRLVALTTHAARFTRSYYFVTPRGKPESPSVEPFRAWLVEASRAFGGPPLILHHGGQRNATS